MKAEPTSKPVDPKVEKLVMWIVAHNQPGLKVYDPHAFDTVATNDLLDAIGDVFEIDRTDMRRIVDLANEVG